MEHLPSKKCRKAREEKINAPTQNQTWDLVLKPKDVKLICYKWVYKVKTCVDGLVLRYKYGFKTRSGKERERGVVPISLVGLGSN